MRIPKIVRESKVIGPRSSVIGGSCRGSWVCSRREQVDDRLGQELNQILQDSNLESPEVAGYDKVIQDDHQQDEQQQTEEHEVPDPDGGPTFGGESLTNGVEGGAAGLLIVEDREPIGGAGFFFIGKSDVIEFPLIMLDDIIKLKRNVRNDQMVGQLESAGWRDVKTIGPWLQEDLRVRQVAAGDVTSELARRMYQVPVVPKRQHRFF